MNKDDIIKLPNSHLRERSQRIRKIDEAVIKLIDDMTTASLDWEDSRPHEISAALAAVQVDSLTRVVIVRSDFDQKANQEFTALINPEIVKYEGEVIEDFEGCLSINHIYGKVPRYSNIRLKALDIDGNEIRLRADGFLARVLQHEIDHTNGIVFIDRIRESKDAFYKLDEAGELVPLDYDHHIKDNEELWSDDWSQNHIFWHRRF